MWDEFSDATDGTTVEDAINYTNTYDGSADQSLAETNRLYTQANSVVDGSSATIISGDNNSLPVVSTSTNAGAATALQLLGSAGTLATQAGSALGNAVNQIKSVPGNFKSAYNAGASGNALSLWWQNASTTDKLLVGLSVVGILVAIRGEL